MLNPIPWITACFETLSLNENNVLLEGNIGEREACDTLLKINRMQGDNQTSVFSEKIKLDEQNICCYTDINKSECTVYKARNDPKFRIFDFVLSNTTKEGKYLIALTLNKGSKNNNTCCKTCFYKEGLSALFHRLSFASLKITVNISGILGGELKKENKIELIGLRKKVVCNKKEYKKFILLTLIDSQNMRYLLSRNDENGFELIKLSLLSAKDASKEYQKTFYKTLKLLSMNSLLERVKNKENMLVVEELLLRVPDPKIKNLQKTRLSYIPLDSLFLYNDNIKEPYNILSKHYDMIDRVYEEQYPDDAELAGIRTILKKVDLKKKEKYL
ncbi:hypothetical protein GINT2_000822 [Glugoides intestinalis]